MGSIPLYYLVPMIMGPIIGAAGGMAGAYFQFRGTSRAASGRVETTDARTLWDQNTNFIRALQSELEKLRLEVNRLGEANDRLEKENVELKFEIRDLKMQLANLSNRLSN